VNNEAPWFERAFGEDYLRVYAHRDAAQAQREIEELARRLDTGAKPRVLDAGCGAGRHLAAWRARGVQAMGFDRSEALLSHAREQGLRVLRADLRAIPLADAAFDVVTLLFTTFGYFDSAEEDQAVLCEAARVLKPGGTLVLDLADPVDVQSQLQAHTQRTLPHAEISETRHMEGRRVVKDVVFRDACGTRAWRESVRLYSSSEAQSMLIAAGLRWRGCGGNLDQEARSIRHVHLAERP
jgi:SAM-dependent methyltransferase